MTEKSSLHPLPISPTYVKVKILGDLNKAKTADGIEVTRVPSIYFPSYSIYPIVCCPYSAHFIFDDPSKEQGHWTPMCTCGSPAGIVGANVYTKLFEPTMTGELIVCLTHMKTFEATGHGVHADGMPE